MLINRKLPKWKRVRQEEEEELEAKQEEGAAERTGEDLCHLSGYNNENARAVSLNSEDWNANSILEPVIYAFIL